MAAYTALTLRLTAWRTRQRRELNAAETAASSHLHEALSMQDTVRLFNRQSWEVDRYDGWLAKYEGAARQTARSLAWLNAGQQTVIATGVTAMMAMMGARVLCGEASVGDLVLVNGLLLQLSIPLNFLGSIYREMRESIVDISSVFDLLERRAMVGGNQRLCLKAGEVHFENVSLVVQGRSLLDGLTLTAKGGSKTAIVGPSGSGKSTLARLLLRMQEAQAGRITIDGQLISDTSLYELREAVSMVPQDCALFNDSLRYNLLYGHPQVDAQELEEVVKACQLHGLDLDRPVGQRGGLLSGGERQRVAIARLLLRHPPIVILDEATASLDGPTEALLMQAIRTWLPTSTLLVIAHRLATVQDADCIYVLGGDGRLAERGTHWELMAWRGLYWRLWQQQREQEHQ